MNEDLAKAARECLVLFGVELLVAKEHDAVLVERAADFGDRRIVEVVATRTPAISAPQAPAIGRTSILPLRIVLAPLRSGGEIVADPGPAQVHRTHGFRFRRSGL
jgi:hypothetical protein